MEHKKNADDIYHVLESQIVSLDIMPCTKLSENDLAGRFGVSRTVVRSALQRLQLSGFVNIVPHVGTVVTAINLAKVSSLIYLRIAVETFVLRDFIRTCSPDQIETIRFHLETLEKLVSEVPDTSDMNAAQMNLLLKEDLQFHGCYFKFAGKELIWKRLTEPNADYSRFIRLDMLYGNNFPDVLKQHKVIMNAVENHKYEDLEHILSAHLYGGIRRLSTKIYAPEFQSYFTQS